MSLADEVSKIAEEEAAALKPDWEKVVVLLKQRENNNHVTVLGVHWTVDSAKAQAQARANNTIEITDKNLGWTEDEAKRWQSRLIDVSKGVQIKYVILGSAVYDPSYYPDHLAKEGT